MATNLVQDHGQNKSLLQRFDGETDYRQTKRAAPVQQSMETLTKIIASSNAILRTYRLEVEDGTYTYQDGSSQSDTHFRELRNFSICCPCKN